MRSVKSKCLFSMFLALASVNAASPESRPGLDFEKRGHIAAMSAHHLCSGLFVVGRNHERSVETVLANDVARFPHFGWDESFQYSVDRHEKSVTVSGLGVEPSRKARYHGDQGCTILPAGVDRIFFEP